ncbi:MAG: hypothetical protein JWN71_3096 [Xanthobacteraceae bacterium]|jgi:hypothetical protein|nr:hypothetical protein [Xanthobacteraceae bacterium]
MTEQVAGTLTRVPISPFRPAYIGFAALALAVMVAAIVIDNHWFLNFVHVMSGTLWTGIDLFMGFIVGPVLRMLPLETRRAVIGGLVPRTLVLMPTLSTLTTTAGWFLAMRMGYFDLPYPEFWWVVAALAIVTVLTIQGLGYLLPTNLRLYYAFQQDTIDDAKIARMMNLYVGVVGFQGLMQVAIMVVMARFVTGL